MIDQTTTGAESPARDPWQEIETELLKAIGYPHVKAEDLPADTFVARFYRARAEVERQYQAALAAKDEELQQVRQERDALKSDQSDWRKGVKRIASCLGDPGENLSCVRLGELALEQRAERDTLRAEVARLRAVLKEIHEIAVHPNTVRH